MNNKEWFVEEVSKIHHIKRVNNVINNKKYLSGQHKILSRADTKWKNKEYQTSKMILQTAKTILQFHTNYLIGKRINLTGSEDKIRLYNKIFKDGRFHYMNYKIVDKVVKYGDCFEYVYVDADSNKIKSKIIPSENGYPVYNENDNYCAFIEYFTYDNIDFYTVFTNKHVEKWDNEGGKLRLKNSYVNSSGLPIHYHNGGNEEDDMFGQGMLEDIKPILDKIEFLINKMDDAIYTNSLNPLPISLGQKIEGSIDADVVGYVLNLEEGSDFKYAIANLDSDSIKFLYNTLMQQLLMIACVPSHIMGQDNPSNVSETSLKMLYGLSEQKAQSLEVYIREGFSDRFDILDNLANIKYANDEYIDIEFNYSKPVNASDNLDNMMKQFSMGAISRQTIIEKSELTADVLQEINRIENENINIENKNME